MYFSFGFYTTPVTWKTHKITSLSRKIQCTKSHPTRSSFENSKMVADKKTRSSEKEDELLLQDFSRRVSTKSSALFYGNAFIVSSIPIWLYWRIHAVDPASTAIILALVTIASTWLVSFAYRNTKHVLKHKVAVKREAAVTKDMNKEVKYYNMFSKFWIIFNYSMNTSLMEDHCESS